MKFQFAGQIAKPAGTVNGQDERRIRAAVDSPARFCSWVIKGRQQGVLPPVLLSEKGGLPMTEYVTYQEHIRHTHNAFCRIVIRHAAIDAARSIRSRRDREISLDYLMDEKHYPFSTTDEYFAEPPTSEEHPFTACGQTVLLENPRLAAALSSLPETEQEMIFLQRTDNPEGQVTYPAKAGRPGYLPALAYRRVCVAFLSLRIKAIPHIIICDNVLAYLFLWNYAYRDFPEMLSPRFY